MKNCITNLIIFILCAFCTHAFGQWSDNMYSAYTYQTYTSYSKFNEDITATDYDADLMEAAIFYETNRQRALYGLPFLTYDYNLCVSAHNHSVDMVNSNFFSHESVVKGKRTMRDRLQQVGYANCACAENIAYCAIRESYAATARYLVEEMWMNSPGHRANILNRDYTHLGCGVAFYYEGGFVYVKTTQNFLRK